MDQASRTPWSTEGGASASYSLGTLLKDVEMRSRILSQETWDSILSHLEEGDVPKAASAIKAALKDIDNVPLSIAVTGETGAGKSTFINALRRVGHEEESAAPAGPVVTTTEGTAYHHLKCPGVTVWDLPGHGGTDFPLPKYLEEIADYDLFFVISATRFKDSDAQLARAIANMKKKVYFVRTKVDHDLITEQRSKPKTFNKDKVLQEIRDYFVRQLQEASVTADRVFLVSSLERSDYDFPELENTLLRDLPAHKRHIFTQFLSSIMEAAIDQKRDSLKQMVWLEALKAGLWAAIPVMGLFSDSDIEKLQETLTRYRSYFGLDDASLEQMARELHVSVEHLKANLQSPHLLSAETEESLWEMLKQYIEKVLSVMGGPIAVGLYFTKTFYLQNYFLETVASDAKALLKKEDLFGDSVGSEEGYSK
ncbi:T-cell-specific guanine nucleotide triphosphate-binding protein 1-like [Heterocephalus glaber]|uniref:T-cell-specific guanine nucleotide triphosphate-binding protein 1-like n=1 Tax=Heterocephalus glaber TaxID=10181 RepID=A0AAX6RLP8_HETGA|nr:T-cell-specific guanine nucleotide triphosphate-binding protein 1-like [Heterocephalus glaber]XP_012920459.1 T-cell-specific guanine nucleotide triphosphate-binding protein 1-like [Heterocephalus glaber]XP_021097696.1 T-cell-specific guanine nucleotide triphosphate-binding protein 1-like [Heterocephalus glaber]